MARILVTRPAAQSAPFIASISANGDEAVALPLLAIEPVTDEVVIEQAKQRILQLADYKHVIFISTNAVHYAWSLIDCYWPQLPVRQQWYAIGKATAGAIHALDIEAEQAGISMNSEALLSHPDLQKIDFEKVLIVRGQGGREHLKVCLQKRGAQVDYCEVYRRQHLRYPQGHLAQPMFEKLDILTITSGETIQQLYDQAIIDGTLEHLLNIPLVAPGERLVKKALANGFQKVYKAENAGLDAMHDAIDRVKNNKKSEGELP